MIESGLRLLVTAVVAMALLASSCVQTVKADGAKEAAASKVAAAPAPAVAPDHRLVVRSYVDGSDFLMVRGSRVWFEHRNWDRPGLAGDQSRPTLLNGIPWWPTWTTAKRSRPTDADVELPTERAVQVTVKPVRARGTAALVEPPNDRNDWTARILLDDDTQLGAAWYEVAIEWE